MVGHAVGPEGQDGVGTDAVDEALDVGDGVGVIDLGARPIVVVEPLMLMNAEDLQGAKELGLADSAHGRGRPAHLVEGALLSPGRRDADDARARANRSSHEPGREVGLVVRMGPHAEDGAERLHRHPP